MTRFKEQRRIDKAIQHENIKELEWALSYCKTRLETTHRKEHKKAWSQQIRKIEIVLESARYNLD